MVKLKLTRAGVFRCSADRDWTQCGVRGIRELRYRVEIRARPDRLTAEGFIIDNLRVKQYFDARWLNVADLPSCEIMAMTACDELRRLVEEGGAECDVVRASIGGVAGDAFLTAELTAEDRPEDLHIADYIRLRGAGRPGFDQ